MPAPACSKRLPKAVEFSGTDANDSAAAVAFFGISIRLITPPVVRKVAPDLSTRAGLVLAMVVPWVLTSLESTTTAQTCNNRNKIGQSFIF